MEERIQADPETLIGLAGKVELVASGLEGASADFGHNHDILRSSLIEDALADFDGAWSDKRKELIETLGASAGLLRQAGEQFRAADSELAGAIDGQAGQPATSPPLPTY